MITDSQLAILLAVYFLEYNNDADYKDIMYNADKIKEWLNKNKEQ